MCVLALGVVGAAAGSMQEPSEWRTMYLTESAVLDIALVPDGTAWAVGEAGTVLYYTGETWQKIEGPTDETLHAVAFAAAGDGWAVGQAGTILHYEGANWHIVNAPVTAADELFDIALVDGDGWAVGQRFNTVSHKLDGLILRFVGGTWTEAAIPRTAPLYAVSFVAADQGWAVGEEGTLLHWDGIEWTRVSIPTGTALYDVAVLGGEVWAVGDQGVRVRWNEEGAHVELTPYRVPFTGIGFAGPDAGWIIGGDSTVLYYDGATWSPIGMPVVADLFGLFVTDGGEVWVTGEGGLVGRVTAEGWQFVTQPYLDADLTAIDMLDIPAGWAVGGWPLQLDAGVVFWQHGEHTWSPRQLGNAPSLFDIDVLSQDEAWAVGQDASVADPTKAGVVWRFTSGSWALAGYPDVSALFAVEAISSDDVWAAGQDGALVHFDGTKWQKMPVSENIHLYGLHFRAPDDGWAVGERFVVSGDPPRYEAVALHYDGLSWQETTIPPGPPRLLAVYALSSQDVWAVGNLGVILHFDGEDWTVVQGQKAYNLLDLDFAGPGDGWAVGTQGTILRYLGNTWTSVASPTDATLNGVVSWPDGEAWAVGSQGTFLYHPPTVPRYVYLSLIHR